MIKKTDPLMLQIFDADVSGMIAESLDIPLMDALRLFLGSETHAMLEDDEMKLWHFSPLAVFDMWEAEQANGDPRTSLYIMEDDFVQFGQE